MIAALVPVVDSTGMRLVSLAVVALAGFLQAGTPAVEPGFTSLFNGKDFSGWKIAGPTESFTIQDGAIVANGAASHAYYDGPVQNHSFRNFELKVDVMTRAGSNGGVYVLTEYQEVGGNDRASGHFPSKGFEIQVNNSHTDRVQNRQPLSRQRCARRLSRERRRVVHRDHHRQGGHDHGQGERQAGRRLDAAGGLDRRPRGAGPQDHGTRHDRLQAHDPKSTVYYKNIRIKPLD